MGLLRRLVGCGGVVESIRGGPLLAHVLAGARVQARLLPFTHEFAAHLRIQENKELVSD